MSTFYGSRYEQICLKLYSLTYRETEFKQREVAQLLRISQKQLSRYLQKLHEDNYAFYKPGLGRTNVSTMSWTAVGEHQVKHLIHTYGMHVVEDFIEWMNDFNDEQDVSLLANFIERNLIEELNKERADHLFIPMHQPILSVHPLEANDYYSVSILHNIYNRLIQVKDEQFIGDLAIDWTYNQKTIQFHLRKNVAFHNGMPLNAYIVAGCIKQNEPLLKQLQIVNIDIVNLFCIQLMFKEAYSEQFVLALFANMNASVYVEENDRLYGTGPFQITTYNKTILQLDYFPGYFREIAMLSTVTLVQVPRIIERQIQFLHEEHAAKEMTISQKETYLLLNPHNTYFKSLRNRQLFLQQWGAKEISTIIETKSITIGISKNKQALNKKLQEVYQTSYANICWQPFQFEDYLLKMKWLELDGIVVTHSFIDQQDVSMLLDMLAGEGIFSTIYPEICDHYMGLLKTSNNNNLMSEFFRVLKVNCLVIPLVSESEKVLIGKNVIANNQVILSNLKDIWRKG